MVIKNMLWGLERMEIKNRLFPYPVLCADNDDYENSVFDVIVEKDDELNDIGIKFINFKFFEGIIIKAVILSFIFMIF